MDKSRQGSIGDEEEQIFPVLCSGDRSFLDPGTRKNFVGAGPRARPVFLTKGKSGVILIFPPIPVVLSLFSSYPRHLPQRKGYEPSFFQVRFLTLR